jgi:hypothetical protein
LIARFTRFERSAQRDHAQSVTTLSGMVEMYEYRDKTKR